MKTKRFREEQIIGILNETAAGAAAVEVCRRHGISETTFYRWKAEVTGFVWAKRITQGRAPLRVAEQALPVPVAHCSRQESSLE